jgi:chromosome segregation ATPase
MSQLDPVTSSDLAAVALDLVAEIAVGIRQSDEQSAHALQRERDIANEIREELGRAELRTERAEAMVRLAETQIEQMLAAAEQADKELEDLRSQLAAKTAELAASERRAGNAETVIEQIVDAIRTQLPTKLSIPTE